MIRIRTAQGERVYADDQWEARVASGEIPPDALVFSLQLTGGLWRRADSLPLYGFFRQGGEEERREAGAEAATIAPFAELPQIAFPRRGFSGTEILLAINLAVGLLLLFLWRDAYTDRVFELAQRFYDLWVDRRIPMGFFATLFMHANLGHISANMVSLVPAAAIVEYLYGRRVSLIYLLGGLAGAVVSFAWKAHGPMSVGASGAIFALYGTFGGYVLRHVGRLPHWHRWRAKRIYLPLLALATLPSILHADWRAHTGGFAAGLLLGLLLPPHERGRRFLLPRRAGPPAETA
jgi:membrane associated rhomboid family serine protease